MTEECAFCGSEGTPWEEIHGHLCFDCHCDSQNKKYLKEKSNEYMECKL